MSDAFDPLAGFRRGSAMTVKAPQPPKIQRPHDDDSTEYVAFKAFTIDERDKNLKLRPAKEAGERLNYNYFLRMTEDHDFGTIIILCFTFVVVTIRGRNLKELADALDKRQCEYIYQFSAAKWAAPRDESACYVESIEFASQADKMVEMMAKGKHETNKTMQATH